MPAGRTLNPIITALEGTARFHVVLGDRADAAVDHLDPDLVRREPERLAQALYGALGVGLHDDVDRHLLGALLRGDEPLQVDGARGLRHGPAPVDGRGCSATSCALRRSVAT